MLVLIVAVAAGITALAHIVPFRSLLDVANHDPVLWRVPVSGAEKPIFLTFDDGPNPAATPELLDLLKQTKTRATFFLIDEYVNDATAPLVRRMFEEGHCVAQHTGRRWLLLRSPSHIAEMLKAGAQKIERLTGRPPARLFRPHAGWRSIRMFRGARKAGYQIVGWSWMSWDWVGLRQRTGPRVASHLLAHAAPGKIMVIHDGHHRNPRADRRYAVAATERIVSELAAAGYTFETLCSLNGGAR